jgi:ADP-ribose pyrophosphatase
VSEPIETPWEGRFIAIRTQGTWEYAVRARDITAAVIVAIDGDAVILVEQERVPLGRRSLELPAGLVGDGLAGEGIEVAAARELEEETGYRAGTLRSLGEYSSSPGMTSETFTLVLCTDLERVGEGGGIDDEDIAVHRVPLATLADFVEQRRAAGISIDVRLLTLLGPLLLADILPRP